MKLSKMITKCAIALLLTSLASCGNNSNGIAYDFFTETNGSDNTVNQSATNAMIDEGPKAIEAKSSFLSKHANAMSLTDTTEPNIISFDTTNMPSIDSIDLEKYFADFIAKNTASEDFSFEDLEPASNFWVESRNGLVTVSYNRTYRGTPVKDAFMEFILAKNGDKYKMYQVYDHTYGDIKVENDSGDMPSLAQASAALNLNLSQEAKRQEVHADEQNGVQKFYYVDSIQSIDKDSNEPYVVNVAYGSNKVLSSYKRIYSANSTIKSKVLKRSHIDGTTVDLKLPLASIEVNGQSLTTDTDGMIELAEDAQDAKITLSSSRVKVTKSGSRSPYTLTADIKAGDTTVIENPSTDQLYAMNSYISIQRANEFVRQYATPSEVGLLKNQVNLTFSKNDSCNAFYQSNGDQISLFSQGNGCANMAVANDVIYHEWGHGLDQYTGKNGGISDGAFSEGIGDLLAAHMTGSSNMGEGFFTDRTTGIRNLKNTKRYPQDRGAVHDEGQIIGGAFWDMREALIKRYGENRGADLSAEYFIRHLLTTDKYVDSLNTVLALDDDDQNAATPSPNGCLIKAAFANHGLAKEEQCEDPIPQTSDLSVDSQMYLGMQGDNGVMASTKNKNVEKIAICEGSSKDCKTKSLSDMKILDLEGGKGDVRMYLGSDMEMNLLSKYTLYGINKDGTAITTREIKVASK